MKTKILETKVSNKKILETKVLGLEILEIKVRYLSIKLIVLEYKNKFMGKSGELLFGQKWIIDLRLKMRQLSLC